MLPLSIRELLEECHMELIKGFTIDYSRRGSIRRHVKIPGGKFWIRITLISVEDPEFAHVHLRVSPQATEKWRVGEPVKVDERWYFRGSEWREGLWNKATIFDDTTTFVEIGIYPEEEKKLLWILIMNSYT